MALLLIELVESFAIAIRHLQRTHRLQLSVDSLLFTSHPWYLYFTLSLHSLEPLWKRHIGRAALESSSSPSILKE